MRVAVQSIPIQLGAVEGGVGKPHLEVALSSIELHHKASKTSLFFLLVYGL